MKAIIILLGFFVFTASVAFSQTEFLVVTRTKKNRPVEKTVVLKDLESTDSFDGKYFKIVKGKSEDAVKFNDNSDLTFRAATAYYHLTIAREYFVNKLNSAYALAIPKMIIRIEHTNQFSELGHFANDNLEPQYNNALTVPAGVGLVGRGVKPWGIEIWFRPSKKIHLNDIQVHGHQGQEYAGMMKQFRNMMHMQTLQRFLAGIVTFLTGQSGNPLAVENIMRTAGSSLLLELSYQLYEPLTRVFKRKWYSLDTALVPEIIYHEYAHAALSDHLELTHSTAIIEGMADFFAGKIADSPKLAKKIKKYNTFNGKDAKKKQQYILQFETTDYANTDFVFGLLWEMEKIVGRERGQDFMYFLRKKITTNSTIRGQLIEGLLETCKVKCAVPFNDRLRILKALDARGI